MTEQLPRMYTDLADWFHLLTPPEEYAEEADFYFSAIADASRRRYGRCWSWGQAPGTTHRTTSGAPSR